MSSKEKSYLIASVDKVAGTSIFSALEDSYQFGADFIKRDALAATATVLVEESNDRNTWSPGICWAD